MLLKAKTLKIRNSSSTAQTVGLILGRKIGKLLALLPINLNRTDMSHRLAENR